METPTTRPARPDQVEWLAAELPRWQADGLIGAEEATTLQARYHATHRMGLAQLLLYLGAGFVGIGLIWLVAANLDQFTPTTRLLVVASLWLAITVAAELLAGRPGHRGGGVPSPVLGAVRGLSALAFGAVIFQAAQSLQVPAYEPALLGWWALGAITYAYAVRGVAPLVVGLASGLAWFLWHVGESGGSALGVLLAILLTGAAAAGVATLHERFGPDEFHAPWRVIGAALSLAGLFAAAVPDVDTADFSPDAISWIVGGVAVLIALVGVAFGCGAGRLEPVAALLVAGVGALLVVWDPDYSNIANGVGIEGWLHAGVSVAAYVAAATWVAVLGIRRSRTSLTYLALVSLVIFTTFQGFAVFAEIIEGAWLFLTLGLLFLGSGYLFDRARKHLAEALNATEGESA